mgnify:CR=1 FL=1
MGEGVALLPSDALDGIMKFPRKSYGNDKAVPHSARILPEVPSKVPATNQVLVDLGKEYLKNAPMLLGPDINNARDFLINVIAPQLTALENGLQDGIEVLRVAMDEEPHAGKYINSLRTMMDHALQVKMANFIAKQCNLDSSEYELFMDLALSRHKETDTNRQLLAVNDLIKSLGGEHKETLTGSEMSVQKQASNPRLARRREMAILNRKSDRDIR